LSKIRGCFDIEFLQDVNAKGKLRDWKEKKQNNLFLADSFQRNYMEKISLNVRNCGTLLEFRKYKDGLMQLTNSNFCKNRLCPLCNWRRSLKIFGQVSKIMNLLQEQNDYKFVFMTLTLKNVKSEKSSLQLSEAIEKLIKCFHLLLRHKEFSCFHGFMRVLEVTYSKKRDEFHPHLHVVFAVNKSYFTGRDYISQAKLTELWRMVCKIDYNPVCDIRKVVNKETGEDSGKALGSAVAEIAKYAVKDSDLLEIDVRGHKGVRDLPRIDRVVRTVYLALYKVKLLGLGGCFKDAKEQLKLGDAEDGSLCDDDELRTDIKYFFERYQWRAGLNNYVLIERKINLNIDCDDE
jgi:plasmid rolling circle replication initiator protein Rep